MNGFISTVWILNVPLKVHGFVHFVVLKMLYSQLFIIDTFTIMYYIFIRLRVDEDLIMHNKW